MNPLRRLRSWWSRRRTHDCRKCPNRVPRAVLICDDCRTAETPTEPIRSAYRLRPDWPALNRRTDPTPNCDQRKETHR